METNNSHKEEAIISIQLPDSKSYLNRILLIERIIGHKREIELESQCADVQILFQSLWSKTETLDIQDAGTPYRLLTAYFAATGESKVLKCSDGMSKRPMKELVESLNEMGADIAYLKEPNHPPISIGGIIKFPEKLALDASRSSQFLSALLLIAPLAKNDFTIAINPSIPSWPYVLLTIQLMREHGIKISLEEEHITVHKGEYSLPNKPLGVEKDWTSASYFYAISAVTGKELHLEYLSIESIQGDKATFSLFEQFGVTSTQRGKNLHLMHFLDKIRIPESLNFEHHPDLAPTFVTLCSLLGCDMKFIGLANLKHKESNRTLALQQELKKIGVNFTEQEDYWYLDTSNLEFPETISFNTYEDHRIAMALSLFMWVTNVHFDKPEVVKKSFPNYWNELLKLTLPEDE